MSEKTIKLKKCPFCDFEHLDILRDQNLYYAVHCRKCGANGPRIPGKEIAADWWNIGNREVDNE